MNPRNLSVLRIDDSLKTKKADAPPLDIDVHSFDVDGKTPITSIRGWGTALRIWASAAIAAEPDLVVADVLFAEDDSTPLSKAPGFKDYSRFIPTGLSHLKPFAAMARGLGRPMGLAIHTSNPSIWREAWTHQHPMAALAAHEIGELAAIFGDLLDGDSLEERVQACWDWLGERSETNFYPALDIAITDYRRRLIEAACPARDKEPDRRLQAFVMPKDWAELAAWCSACAAGKCSGLIEENQALPLVYADGRKDCIRFRSLFGEVEHLATEALPAHCFAMPGADPREVLALAPWATSDKDGNPKIGAFVQALGSLKTIFHQAVSLVERFDATRVDGDTLASSLSDEAARVVFPELTQGLAILLQAVRWEHLRYRLWQEGLSQEGWNHREQRLWNRETQHRPNVQDSLGDFLERLAGYMGAVKDEEVFGPCDLVEAIPGERVFHGRSMDGEWLCWYFDLLVDAGVLLHVLDGYRVSHCSLLRKEIPAPARLPIGFPGEAGDLRSQLRDTLGFGKKYRPERVDDHNAIGRLLASAFLTDRRPPAGREFLDDLLNGVGPAWIFELLRSYASENLEWKEQKTWPRWLRSQG